MQYGVLACSMSHFDWLENYEGCCACRHGAARVTGRRKYHIPAGTNRLSMMGRAHSTIEYRKYKFFPISTFLPLMGDAPRLHFIFNHVWQCG